MRPGTSPCLRALAPASLRDFSPALLGGTIKSVELEMPEKYPQHHAKQFLGRVRKVWANSDGLEQPLISGTAVDTENLIVAVRSLIANAGRVREVRMFGGTGFMLDGNLIAGVSQRGLLVRVGRDQHRQAVEMGARPVVMRGRTMTGYVRIDAEPLDDGAVRSWIVLATEFVKGLPPKASGSKPRRTARAKK